MDYYTGKDYGPGQGMGYTTVMPKDGFQYRYGEDGTRYSVPIEGYKPNNPGFDGEEKSLIQPVAPPTDQEIRDEGLKFMPQQKYLQKPFELPTKKTEEKGITNTNAFNNSGGNDFSVYNPDPNSIVNRNYDPYRFRQAESPIDQGSDPSYFNAPEKSKFQEMLSKGVGFIPGVGMAKKGLDALDNMLPVNRRAIMENELSGQGIMVNDIGQIVSDGGAAYKEDGSNIMAGYNANKITKDTFTKRRTKAQDNMSADGFKEFNKALTAAEERILGTATTQTNKIFDFEEEEKNKKKKTGNVITRFLTKKKDTTSDNDVATTGSTTNNSGGGFTYDTNTTGQAKTSKGGTYTPSVTPQDAQTNQESRRGQYFFGGRVNYKAGGRINFRGGGMDMGNEENQAQSAAMGNTTVSNNNNNDGGASDNPPVTVVNNNPVDISTVTKSVGDYKIPYGVEALLANRGKFKAVINPDNILDKNLGAEFTYDQGPYQVGFNADMEGNKNLGVSYNKGNLSAYANTDFDNPSLGFKYSKTFANGGLAGLL